MQTIQVVLDDKLLRATDSAARREKLNRSALIRNALRDHLKKLKIRELEERERRAYALKPQTVEEIFDWEAEAAWPEE
jgi:metal-responsive CopG/Arc/MetJ family transcriptional regulator